MLHSGIHEHAGSLKAHLCAEGQKLMVELAARVGVASLRHTGLLLIKADDSAPQNELAYVRKRDLLIDNARNLKLEYQLLDKSGAAGYEPLIETAEAMLIPDVWTVDPTELTQVVAQETEQAGVEFLFNHELTGADVRSEGITLETSAGDIMAAQVINSAGLKSDKVARWLGFPDYEIFPTQGEYYWIKNPKYKNITGMINFIMPPQSGKGMYLFSRNGELMIGPNWALSTERSNKQESSGNIDEFVAGAKSYFADLSADDLEWAFTGFRPRSVGPDQEADFIIMRESDQIINLIGIESPGLTSALAIGSYVNGLLD